MLEENDIEVEEEIAEGGEDEERDLRSNASSPVSPLTGKPTTNKTSHTSRNPIAEPTQSTSTARSTSTPLRLTCQGTDRFTKINPAIPVEDAADLANQYRESGSKIVFTNGCFDLLHVGHVSMLEASASLGYVLFVAINSDASVRRLKGPDRPIIAEQDRANMLAALSCVDHVLIFDDATAHRLLEAIRPDILVKGGTTSDIVGREIVERYGGRVDRTAINGDWSTTGLVKRLKLRNETMAESEH